MLNAQAQYAGRAPVLVVGTHSVHVRRFVAGLCEAGQAVVLATDDAEPLYKHELFLDQLVVNFSMRQWRTGSVIAKFSKRWAPRVIHAHQANSVAWHAGRAARQVDIPMVLTLWGSDVLLTPHQGMLKRRMVVQALKSAAVWTADATELLRAAHGLAGHDRSVAWIPIGVDDVPARLDSLWPVKKDRLLSCRLHKPLYRIDDIVRSFAKVAPSHPNWCLEVAASGVETAALRQLAQPMQAINFSGFLSAQALRQSYSKARVYLSFPISDGTSVSLLEAMSLGCFPIVSDLPANREWIVDGLNGLVVSRAKDLPAAIERGMMISHSTHWREVMAPENLRVIRQKAMFSHNIQQFLGLYAGLGR